MASPNSVRHHGNEMGRKLFLFAAAREAAYGPFATVCATPAFRTSDLAADNKSRRCLATSDIHARSAPLISLPLPGASCAIGHSFSRERYDHAAPLSRRNAPV